VKATPPAQTDTRPAPGDAAVFVDTIPPDAPKPLEPTERQKAEAKAAAKLPQPPPAPTPTPAVPVVPLPMSRYYLLEAVSAHGRRGAQSTLLTVPLTEPPAPPRDAVLKFDEKTLTFSWTADPGKSLFNVYDVDATGRAPEV